jgi:hypothetical protein
MYNYVHTCIIYYTSYHSYLSPNCTHKNALVIATYVDVYWQYKMGHVNFGLVHHNHSLIHI